VAPVVTVTPRPSDGKPVRWLTVGWLSLSAATVVPTALVRGVVVIYRPLDCTSGRMTNAGVWACERLVYDVIVEGTGVVAVALGLAVLLFTVACGALALRRRLGSWMERVSAVLLLLTVLGVVLVTVDAAAYWYSLFSGVSAGALLFILPKAVLAFALGLAARGLLAVGGAVRYRRRA
jgi:hypothetical protein